ncbi:hypothetical protein FF1_004097 [Malus domestica]
MGCNGWVAKFSTGCAGFFVGDGEKREFWVMGGYGESRTISGVFPVDEHYKDDVVMELKNENGSCRWREVGDMWEAGERVRLGKIVVIEDDDDCGGPAVFMLDRNVIVRVRNASVIRSCGDCTLFCNLGKERNQHAELLKWSRPEQVPTQGHS